MSKQRVRRVELRFRASDDRVLFRRAWLPAEAERVLLLVHGYAEHSGRYEDLGTWFANRGCAVHAYDHRGHGRSDGARAHVRRFEDYVDDLEGFLKRVRDEHPELPVTAVGHSMGGLITAALLADRRPPMASAVLSAAALDLGAAGKGARVSMARWLSHVFPRFPLPSGVDPNGLSRDPEVVRRYREDRFVSRNMTSSLAAEFVSAVSRTASRAAEIQVPLLLLHGEDDPICRVEGSRLFFQGVTSTGSHLHTYPELLHEVFQEPEWERVAQDVLDWLSRMEH